jgi:transcriptional regulator with XRE-family HTH domain
MPGRKKQIEHDPVVARFGQRLREVRHSRGLTQAQLAEKAQVTVSYITRLENGSYAAGIDLAARLAAALGTPLADLLPTDPPPDDLAVLRRQAKELSDALVRSADRETLLMLVPLLARLGESRR